MSTPDFEAEAESFWEGWDFTDDCDSEHHRNLAAFARRMYEAGRESVEPQNATEAERWAARNVRIGLRANAAEAEVDRLRDVFRRLAETYEQERKAHHGSSWAEGAAHLMARAAREIRAALEPRS